MADDEIHRAEEVGRREGGRKLQPRQIAALVLGALIVLFALSNTEESGISFFWIWDVRMPRIFVIAICGLVGFGIGWLIRGRADRND